MNELTIIHIGDHYEFVQELALGHQKHLKYTSKLESSDLIRNFLEIQECKYFISNHKSDDEYHYIYLNGKYFDYPKVEKFSSLEDAVNYLSEFKKAIAVSFEIKDRYTI